MARFKRFAFLLACLLIFPAFGHASSFSHSEFSPWNFQISPESGQALTLFNGAESRLTVSADDSTQGIVSDFANGNDAILPLQVSSGSADAGASYAWFYPQKMEIAASANVSLPDSTTFLQGEANGLSTMNNIAVFFTGSEDLQTNVTFSFNYKEILQGFSSDAYGYFDSSLSVDLKIRDVESGSVFSLFSINDGISGRNTSLSKGDGDKFFESDFLLSYGTLYSLEWTVDSKAAASVDTTPEPSTIFLLGSGIAIAFFIRNRKKNA
jgi:hypothetical protein